MDVQPSVRRVAINGVTLGVYEWPGAGPPVLLAHANGYHARCWDPVVAQLPGRRCIAVDLRGHGLSDKPRPPYSWQAFGADVAALACESGLVGAVGVGHSLGGYAVALAATLAPAAFAALLLVDPVILAPEAYTGRMAGVHGAARRRGHWHSPHALYQRLHNRLPFSRWEPAALQAYCDYGLVPAPDGHGCVLACPPDVEADLYAGATEYAIYAAIATIKIPVLIVRGHPYAANPTAELSASPTYPGVADYFPDGRDLLLEHHSHYIPMEDPALVARLIAELR